MPNDTYFGNQWNLKKIEAQSAWNAHQSGAKDFARGKGAIVAVIDSGCDLEHPDLVGAFVSPQAGAPSCHPTQNTLKWEYMRAHGTANAGIIGARADNKAGIAGIAPKCSIMPMALNKWDEAELASSIEAAAQADADVINICYGQHVTSQLESQGGSQEDSYWYVGNGYSYLWTKTGIGVIAQAIKDAVEKYYCLVCACAGNFNVGDSIFYPARESHVIACGASDKVDGRWTQKVPVPGGYATIGSNYDSGNINVSVDVVAPAVDIITTDLTGPNDGFSSDPTYEALDNGKYFRGYFATSPATAHVSGLAAAIQALAKYKFKGLRLDPMLVRRIICETADEARPKRASAQAIGKKVPDLLQETSHGLTGRTQINRNRTAELGYGRVNMKAALKTVDSLVPPP